MPAMHDRPMTCLADPGDPALKLHAVRPEGLDALLASLPPAQAAFLRQTGFAAGSGSVALLADADGLAGAVLGLGMETGPYPFGALPAALPAGTTWRLALGDHAPDAALLGYCLGAYRYDVLRAGTDRELPRLVPPEGTEAAREQAAAVWMVRDLINAPANRLGPAELADAAAGLATRFGATLRRVEGDALREAYPTIAAVGAGSARPPAVVAFHWRGSRAHESAPLVSLCGKGVCFDTGGYDLKPSSGMLRMKKDMGGAAIALGLARLIMQADLPVRLAVRIGCVENSVSGSAMRPLDVLRTRRGLTVEVGNTDAEGRLVLCDLLAEASDEQPDLLLDFATLTGAARVALGPDLPALFTRDDALAESLLAAGRAAVDPMWRLPLWDSYTSWLDSPIADLNNVSSKPFAGAIVAALFLERFVAPGTRWAHLDVYAWNDQTRPGRPEGGEAQAMRGLFAALASLYGALKP